MDLAKYLTVLAASDGAPFAEALRYAARAIERGEPATLAIPQLLARNDCPDWARRRLDECLSEAPTTAAEAPHDTEAR